MVLTGHQPNYLPYLGLLHKISQADLFVIVDTVQFVKRGPFGFQNRAKIRTKTGWCWLTVPVLTKGKFHQSIRETKINNKIPWQRKHWKSILLNYQGAPYFGRYGDFLEEIYNRQWEYLADLNETIIRYLLKELGIKIKVVKASEVGPVGKGTDLIVDMCRKLGANTYLHGKHGRDYVDESKFREAGLRSIYQEFHHPVYGQQFGPFLPNMAGIDLLFNHGEESLDILLGRKPIPSS